MKALFLAAEMSPLAKVGGLGDVAGSLPRALRATGLDVRVAMPLHSAIDVAAIGATRVAGDIPVPWPDGSRRTALWRAEVRGVPVYLVDCDRFFGRPGVYGYEDDNERFLFFCDALLAAAPHLDFSPDVLHCNDWHTALLLTRLAGGPAHRWQGCGTLYTIHNLGITGEFDAGFAKTHEIPVASPSGSDGIKPDVTLSAMAQGIMHAGCVNTVSETYAREIMTPEYGAGLDALLRARAATVSGIVNGIDYDEFDPETDPAIAQNYGISTLDGRAENKRALQRRAELPEDDGAPLFGAVTRLFPQKGMDLVAEAFDVLLATHDAQLVVLGTGDKDVEAALTQLQRQHPAKVKVWLEFNAPLGQQIYAGCDVFLMPSRYEPCGLGQLISLRYGAVPLVRRTGGLADTVEDAGTGLASGTGFVFDEADAASLRAACERAIAAYRDREGWRAMQRRGMRQDRSWSRAAGSYAALYERALAAGGALRGARP